jgi:hypothetical protein
VEGLNLVRHAAAVEAVSTVLKEWREVVMNVEEVESTILPRVPEEGPVQASRLEYGGGTIPRASQHCCCRICQ